MKIRVLGLIVARGWELCSAESLACADLFLGQINEISSDFGGATSLSGTVDEKCDLRDPFRDG